MSTEAEAAVAAEIEEQLGEEDPVKEQDPKDQLIPGTKLTFKEAERRGVPDKMIKVIPHMAQQAGPRRLGIIESNGDWYLYRSVGRREFKAYVKEATQRAVQTAKAAQQNNEDVNVPEINAESSAYLEEKITAQCCLFPSMNMAKMGDCDAGIPKLIHDAVLQRSNFEQTSEPISL